MPAAVTPCLMAPICYCGRVGEAAAAAPHSCRTTTTRLPPLPSAPNAQLSPPWCVTLTRAHDGLLQASTQPLLGLLALASLLPLFLCIPPLTRNAALQSPSAPRNRRAHCIFYRISRSSK